jgi:hypothetical protein
MIVGMSDREQRQYPLMRQRIDNFRDGALSIAHVIADLEGLVDALDETPQEWKDSFVEEWSVLEIAYAVALDRQQPMPTAGDHVVAAALDALEALIAERTANPG